MRSPAVPAEGVTVGIDIGSSALKAVELKAAGKGFKVIAFAVAGVLAGLSGALVTLDLGVISPAMFGVVPSIEMVIWVAVGGRNSLLGAIVGTLVVNFGKDWISSVFPDLWLYVVGAVFVLVVTVAPQGIVGLMTSLRARSPRLGPATPPALVE